MRSWAALFHHTTETHASKGAIGERKRWLRGTGRRIQNTKIIIAASESLKLMSTHLPRQLLWSEHRDIWEITYACEDTHMRVQTMTMRNPGRQAGSYINDNEEDCVCSTLFIILLDGSAEKGFKRSGPRRRFCVCFNYGSLDTDENVAQEKEERGRVTNRCTWLCCYASATFLARGESNRRSK